VVALTPSLRRLEASAASGQELTLEQEEEFYSLLVEAQDPLDELAKALSVERSPAAT
jgi:hypothetical protein